MLSCARKERKFLEYDYGYDYSHTMNQISIPAGEFKAKCLKLMDKVAEENVEYLITKRGMPVARLQSARQAASPLDLWGSMQGSCSIKGEIVDPVGDEWNVG